MLSRRVAGTIPPSIEPSPLADRARPARAREPWASVKAGAATSIAPTAPPMAALTRTSVRIPAILSGRLRERLPAGPVGSSERDDVLVKTGREPVTEIIERLPGGPVPRLDARRDRAADAGGGERGSTPIRPAGECLAGRAGARVLRSGLEAARQVGALDAYAGREEVDPRQVGAE